MIECVVLISTLSKAQLVTDLGIDTLIPGPQKGRKSHVTEKEVLPTTYQGRTDVIEVPEIGICYCVSPSFSSSQRLHKKTFFFF